MRLPFDIDHLYPIDSRPFYRAVLTNRAEASELLDEHPIDHRPILVWNAAMKSIAHWFGHRAPGRKPRKALLAHYESECAWLREETGIDALPVIETYIKATFDPKTSIKQLVKVPMDPLCETGLSIPAVIADHYAWKAGEREALIMTMYLFDHTLPGKR